MHSLENLFIFNSICSMSVISVHKRKHNSLLISLQISFLFIVRQLLTRIIFLKSHIFQRNNFPKIVDKSDAHFLPIMQEFLKAF